MARLTGFRRAVGHLLRTSSSAASGGEAERGANGGPTSDPSTLPDPSSSSRDEVPAEHAVQPLSVFRMREESVIEKNVAIPHIRRRAMEVGFSRMRVVPLRSSAACVFDYAATPADLRGDVLREDLGRTPLPRDVAPGEEIVIDMTVDGPLPAGRYELRYDMVVEGVTWFEFQGSPCPRRGLEVAS